MHFEYQEEGASIGMGVHSKCDFVERISVNKYVFHVDLPRFDVQQHLRHPAGYGVQKRVVNGEEEGCYWTGHNIAILQAVSLLNALFTPSSAFKNDQTAL